MEKKLSDMMITHTNNGSTWLLVSLTGRPESIQLLDKSKEIKSIGYYDDKKENDAWREKKLPPGNYSIVGLASELTEEQWKEVMPTILNWSKELYYNYTASGSDFRDIIESAFENPRESGQSLLRSHGLNEKTTLIIKKQ